LYVAQRQNTESFFQQKTLTKHERQKVDLRDFVRLVCLYDSHHLDSKSDQTRDGQELIPDFFQPPIFELATSGNGYTVNGYAAKHTLKALKGPSIRLFTTVRTRITNYGLALQTLICIKTRKACKPSFGSEVLLLYLLLVPAITSGAGLGSCRSPAIRYPAALQDPPAHKPHGVSRFSRVRSDSWSAMPVGNELQCDPVAGMIDHIANCCIIQESYFSVFIRMPNFLVQKAMMPDAMVPLFRAAQSFRSTLFILSCCCCCCSSQPCQT
jgi:hypothetical protein